MDIKNIIDEFKNECNSVVDGNSEALMLLANIRWLKKEIDKIDKIIEPIAIDDSDDYPKQFDKGGFSFSKSEGSRRFDFSNIEEYAVKKIEIKALEEKYRLAYNNAINGMSSINEHTGEIIELPNVTYTKQSITIKRK